MTLAFPYEFRDEGHGLCSVIRQARPDDSINDLRAQLQDTTTETAGNTAGTRPTDFLLDCPEEFRPILQTSTAKTLHDAYPQVSGLAFTSS